MKRIAGWHLGEDESLLTFIFPRMKERPCTRCIKRNIGHLCHDEQREPSKRARSEHEQSAADEEGSSNNEYPNVHSMPRKVDIQDAAGQQILADGTLGLTSSPMNAVQPGPMSSSTGQNLGVTSQQQRKLFIHSHISFTLVSC